MLWSTGWAVSTTGSQRRPAVSVMLMTYLWEFFISCPSSTGCCTSTSMCTTETECSNSFTTLKGCSLSVSTSMIQSTNFFLERATSMSREKETGNSTRSTSPWTLDVPTKTFKHYSGMYSRNCTVPFSPMPFGCSVELIPCTKISSGDSIYLLKDTVLQCKRFWTVVYPRC